MTKSCKMCGKPINTNTRGIGFFSIKYCEDHDRLIKWRSGCFPPDFNGEWPDFEESKIQIIIGNDSYPCYKYNEDIDTKLTKFANETDSVFLITDAQSQKKQLITIKQYDYETGFLTYYNYPEKTKEESIFIFKIYTIERVIIKHWEDKKGYKGVFQEPHDTCLYSKGNPPMCFKRGETYDVDDLENVSHNFYKYNYYGDGDGDSETPFRFCPDLVDVFEWFSEVIISPLTTKQKIFHVKAYHAAKLVNGHTGWAAQKIIFEREVTPDEIIDYFNAPDLRDQLYSILENKKASYDNRTPDQIWQDYVNRANT